MRNLTLTLTLLLVLPGCAAIQRESRARELAGDHVYEKPISEVFPHVKALLLAQGYVAHDAAPLTIETEWKQEVTGSQQAGAWSRYTVLAKDGGNRCVVRFLKTTRAGETLNTHEEEQNTVATGREEGSSESHETARYGTNVDQASALEHDKPDADVNGASAEVKRGTAASKVSGARDLNMEWLLLQRADPDAAAKIYADAVQH